MAAINPTPEYMAQLLSMVPSPVELRRKGFVLQPLSAAELLKKARCDRCLKRPSKFKSWRNKAQSRLGSGNEGQTVTQNNAFSTKMVNSDDETTTVGQGSTDNTWSAYEHNDGHQDKDIEAVTVYRRQWPGVHSANSFNGLDGQSPNVPVPSADVAFIQVNQMPMTNDFGFPVTGTAGMGFDSSMTDAARAYNGGSVPSMMLSSVTNNMTKGLGGPSLGSPMVDNMDNYFDPTERRIEPTQPSKGKLARAPQQLRCYNCHGLGHRAIDCPNMQNAVPSLEGHPLKPVCQWHSGERRGRIFLCCRAPVSTPGCHTATSHSLPSTLTPSLTTRFQVHATPPAAASNPEAQAQALLAVAIDCEMGTSLYGEPELIRVTLIDYFSGAVLLNSLVWPDVDMAHFNTRYSGVTAPQMRAARRDRACLFGVAAARREVWRYVDEGTVVVGHDVKHDLSALRWAHSVVVDSMLVEEAARKALEPVGLRGKENHDAASSGAPTVRLGRAGQAPAAKVDGEGNDAKEAAKPKAPGLSLKAVSKLRLGRDIQRRTHDSFEDALASRDITHHHVAASLAAGLVEGR